MSKTNRPNFLFILSDDQGPWALNHAGAKGLRTDHLDRLAKEGICFENFFCASPVCSPARASILTGKIPSAHGVHDWIRSGNVDRGLVDSLGIDNPYGGYVDEEKPIAYLEGQRTFTQVLSDHGYNVALSGKWHLGDSMRPQQGFSRWYTIGKGGSHYYAPDIIEDGHIAIEERYVTDLFTDKAMVFLDELAEDDKPFYLAVHYTAPHSPWEKEQHPAEWIDYYDDFDFPGIPDVPDHPDSTVGPVYGTTARHSNLRGYYAAISAMDQNIGRLLEHLDQKGLGDNTVVIFMSDNGMCMGHHGVWGKGNATFPQNMYEESIKVPFIIRYPALSGQGDRVVSDLASALDIYPTILDLAGIRESDSDNKPGSSLKPLLTGGRRESRAVFICEEYGPVRMIRDERYKYIHRYPYGPNEFYDLAEDPGEEENLIHEEASSDLIFTYRRDLENWYRRYVRAETNGVYEDVSGLGQMGLVGSRRSRNDSFYRET